MGMSLEMKYFVLKPRAKQRTDAYSNASQQAMFAYADAIEGKNMELALDLRVWAGREVVRQDRLENPNAEG
jgi:hypothetical protein